MECRYDPQRDGERPYTGVLVQVLEHDQGLGVMG